MDELKIKGERSEERVGVWVVRNEKKRIEDGRMWEEKIEDIGIRMRSWVRFKGIEINVEKEIRN